MLSERSSLATQTGFAVFRKLGTIVNKNLEAFPLGLAIVRIAKILPKTLRTRGLVLKEHESFWRNIYERHTFFCARMTSLRYWVWFGPQVLVPLFTVIKSGANLVSMRAKS